MLDLFGSRPADQIVSRTIRITLGGKPFELPVRSIRKNREWAASLDARFAGAVAGLDAAGDDLSAILGLFQSQSDVLLELLLSYDSAGVLPSKDEIEDMEPNPTGEIVVAVREVWRAVNPFLVTAVETAAAEIPVEPSSPPTSTPRRATASRRGKSKTN